MLEVIFVNLGYGLLLSIMVGPAFFILIETSITKGVKEAFYLDLGVLIGDLIYITIALLFVKEVNEWMVGDNRGILKIIGGAAFAVFGIINLIKNQKKNFKLRPTAVDPKDLNATNHVMMVVKGFMICALNPGVLFYWLTIMSVLPVPDGVTDMAIYYQMFGILLILITFFGIDILKIVGAKKLKDFLTPSWIRVVNLVLGVILILFGLVFLVQGITEIMK